MPSKRDVGFARATQKRRRSSCLHSRKRKMPVEIGKCPKAMVGLNAIGAGPIGMGNPKDSVLQYRMAIRIDGGTSRGRSRRSRGRVAPVTCASWVCW